MSSLKEEVIVEVTILAILAIIGYLVVIAQVSYEKQGKVLSYQAIDESQNAFQEEIPLKPLEKLKDGQKYRIKYHMTIYETKTHKRAYTIETEKVVTVHNTDKKQKN